MKYCVNIKEKNKNINGHLLIPRFSLINKSKIKSKNKCHKLVKSCSKCNKIENYLDCKMIFLTKTKLKKVLLKANQNNISKNVYNYFKAFVNNGPKCSVYEKKSILIKYFIIAKNEYEKIIFIFKVFVK